MTEKNIGIIKRAFNGVVPEVPAVYYEKVDYFTPMDTVMELVPYSMMKLFSEDEMKMVNALPGTVESVTAATGFDPAYVGMTLVNLAKTGRIMFTPDGGFVRVANNMAMVFDLWFFALDSQGVKITKELADTFYLLRHTLVNLRENPDETAVRMTMRIIPKYESIKNVPGVMPCENIKEILLRNQATESLVSVRCICKVLTSMWQSGSYPGAADENPCYIKEGDCSACGHCLQAGATGQYIKNVYGGYALSEEEVYKKLEELHEADVMHVVSNTRDPSTLCNCHFDYCFPRDFDVWEHIPSRFRSVRNEDKCANCGKCQSVCQFGAIDPKTLAIDPEKCYGCGLCVTRCPEKALKMEIVRPASWIPEDTIM